MRLFLSAAACALALAACRQSETPKPEEMSPDMAAAHPAHDATAMDASMSAADAADDASMQATPDGYTFHTFPKKIEIVRLPHDGTGAWSAHGYAEADYFRMIDSRDEPVGGPARLHAVRFEMLASGNGKVVFEKRASDNPNDPVIQALSVNFMIH